MAPPAFWNDLEQRGIIQQTTNPELGDWLAKRSATEAPLHVYCGFDPTADSLHIGSLMPVLGLRRMKEAGIKPIAVVGGATGMIGDPSFKATERAFLDAETLEANVAGITNQLEELLEGDAGKDFLLLNNLDWTAPISFIDFLRDVGKHFSVNMMVAKESVRSRLEDREHGISYTEFSYMLLQAYDFLHLFDHYGCRFQVGGSDQWGNITAGIDLIHRRRHGEEVHGCTFPLITTTSGQKFGKSERGAIWIDRARTHPYFLYKYFFHTEDADVARFLDYFTFLPEADRLELSEQTREQPQFRAAQKTLAREVTTIVHGAEVAAACNGLEHAMHVDDVEQFERHAETLKLLDPEALSGAEHDATLLPVAHLPRAALAGAGASALEVAVAAGLFKSKGDGRREITGPNSGFHVDGRQVTEVDFRITDELVENRRVLRMRKGKKNKRMLCFH